MRNGKSATRVQPTRCLSVVMPCYDEEATIIESVERVLASPYVGELIVVDDGSTDGSVGLVRRVADPRLRLFVQPCNLGKGAALRRGLIKATLPYVIVQDADLEYDPADYGTLLEPLIANRADVVFGSRFHNSRPHRVLYFWHYVGNNVLTTMSNMATNLNLSDMEACYKVFRREVVQSLTFDEDRFGFEPEVTAKVAAAGWRIYEVGISYAGRTYAEGKKIGWKDGVRALYCIGRYAASARLTKAPAVQPASTPTTGKNQSAWLTELMVPYLRGRILLVDPARSALSDQLARFGTVTFAETPDAAGLGRFDTIVVAHALEPGGADVELLSRLSERLTPEGHLLAVAHAASSIAGRGGYHRGGLLGTAYRAGLDVLDVRRIDALGAFVPQPVRRLYDAAVVPLSKRLESRRRLPVGDAFLLVARREIEAQLGVVPGPLRSAGG